MSWDDAKPVEPSNEAKVEPQKGEADAKPIEGGNEPAEPPQGMVPQSLVGQIAKKIREKGRHEIDALSQENMRLKQQIEQLEGMRKDDGSSQDVQIDEKIIEQKVQQVFLQKQDAYGKEKYGKDYSDAVLLIQAQNDPVLTGKIFGSANPADTLMKEAQRIAEDLTHADDPGWREREMKEKIRKEVEAEYAEKFRARGNQPTDVSNVRAAGGDVVPEPKVETWGSSLPK